eukprot:jgi/Orpsp1_1/1189946/evm.model.d7180000075691.1
MNLTFYKILLLKDLIYNLKKNQTNHNDNINIIQSTSSNEKKKIILIGFIEIKPNPNSIPYFSFSDNTASIKCQFSNFNECWLSNILYTDSWNLIKYSKDEYYLEINSFSILMENFNLMEFFETNFQKNFKSLINRNYIKVPIIERERQEKLYDRFKNIIFPIIKDTLLTNEPSKYFQKGITIIGSVRSKSSLQFIKQDNITIYYFIFEIIIKPFKTQFLENEDYISTFVIFRTHKINDILINYQKLLVKKTYIFQNILFTIIKLSRKDSVLTKKIFQFIPKESNIEEFIINSDSKLITNKNESSVKLNTNSIVIDLTGDSPIYNVNDNVIDLTQNDDSDSDIEQNNVQYNMLE